jgi:hypothetical protein
LMGVTSAIRHLYFSKSHGNIWARYGLSETVSRARIRGKNSLSLKHPDILLSFSFLVEDYNR